MLWSVSPGVCGERVASIVNLVGSVGIGSNNPQSESVADHARKIADSSAIAKIASASLSEYRATTALIAGTSRRPGLSESSAKRACEMCEVGIAQLRNELVMIRD